MEGVTEAFAVGRGARTGIFDCESRGILDGGDSEILASLFFMMMKVGDVRVGCSANKQRVGGQTRSKREPRTYYT